MASSPDKFPLVWTEDQDSMLASVGRVHDLVQAEMNKGVPPERIVLGGFSQGCVVSLLALLSLPRPIGGAFCMSGWLAMSRDLQRSPAGASILVSALRHAAWLTSEAEQQPWWHAVSPDSE